MMISSILELYIVNFFAKVKIAPHNVNYDKLQHHLSGQIVCKLIIITYKTAKNGFNIIKKIGGI